MTLHLKKHWIHFFFFICLSFSIFFAVLWFYVWPEGLGNKRLGFLFFLVRYGHSFVWFLISIATSMVWINLVRTGKLAVPGYAKLMYHLAGCTYALFVLISFVK
ncbi:hypothetical protein EHQ23_03805 [Leptospira bourretii]|uniref:Uncharacterized protein n=1 Tax=Leptospira bourretii TaxID=2484962 RepID=A0A4R9IIL9_9LEPT|nr:hypothetical protein [Leptospira bourretii]TGK87984.1 hypothetical protein EHQ23_03805 [Leptospira bourretii]TGK88636.1 hypothetical protein EHQ26_16330 [Leptospira bourretii]TGL20530.1 hypothetical protein EHQ47_13370 [Leptospira bourretii]TGL32824.1 hypothetical protein EHQ45_11510 [Leptospira bourretii]